MCLVIQNFQLESDMSQEPMGTTDSNKYYSTIGNQPHVKLVNNNNALCTVSVHLLV